ELAASLADADQVESSAARPLHVRERRDGHIGDQGIQNSSGPIVVFGPGDDFQRSASFISQTLPRIVVGRKLLGEHKNALAFFDRQISRGGSNAIAGGRNNRDAF